MAKKKAKKGKKVKMSDLRVTKGGALKGGATSTSRVFKQA